MTGIRINFAQYPCHIDWSTVVSGVNRVTQNVATQYRTERGSDIMVDRGNDLAATVRSGGMYDHVNAQHALNFAVIETCDAVRALETSIDLTETLGTFSATIVGSSGRRLAVDLKVTNGAGVVASMPVQLTA